MKPLTNRSRATPHRGILKTEVLLAFALLVSSMGVASTLIHRVNRLWSDAGQYQFAIQELSNQMDELVRLSPDHAEKAVGSISPSTACAKVLREPKVSGEIADDTLGKRITLQLSWKDRKDANPVVLSAWLIDAEQTTNAEGESQ